MSIDVLESVITLLAAILGLLLALFKYIEMPRRGWLYISVFFLTHLLSDYYWTTYTLVMGKNPDVSEFMAYFGWNIGYIFLLLCALEMRPEGAKRFFHPLVLLPVPINICQFALYIQYGGLLNNIWEGVLATAAACLSLQTILYYRKNKTNGAGFPWTHTALLLFILMEYGMWTSSCFTWPSDVADPYYYFSFANCVVLVSFGWAIAKDYEFCGIIHRERSAQETRFQILLEIAVSAILFFGCAGGYYFANLMKKTVPYAGNAEEAYGMIAIMLFVVSIVLDILILMVVIMAAMYNKKAENIFTEETGKSRGRFNFVFTILITLILMIGSVFYTSRLFHRVSVTGVIEDGKERVVSTAADLENYLGVARSVLWVAADTVDIMVERGESQKAILDYIMEQTENQSKQFDENFTGLYAYINGEYMDGVGWEPPLGYDPESRDWFKAAVKAGGKTVIVSPYVDMQTGSVVITICKLLKNSGKNGKYRNRQVVALDVVVNHVKDVAEKVNIDGKGYAMVVSREGLIVAHHDSELNGIHAAQIYGKDFIKEVVATGSGVLDTVLAGRDSTLFVDSIIDQWYVVIVVSDKELFSEINHQLWVNVFVSLIIFLLITFFYYLGYQNEQLNGKKVEEMRISKQKQEYEAKVLKLEKKAADEANEAKSRFLADMSHEIRTPINAILGMNEMVLRETDDEGVLDYARNIRISGKNLLQIINSILDFSKIEDGKMEIVPMDYSTGAMITYLVASIRERAAEKGLELKVNVDSALPQTLYGDDGRIKQVIMNLLTNAVKYTPKGYVQLTIEGRKRENGKLLLYVEVKDTGIGIRESDRDKLFASFERLDLKKNRNIEGTGLGMSITTSLLKLMESELSVESVYGEGSVFYFSLWQGISNAEPLGDYDIKQAKEEEEVRKKLLYAPTANILIVDDTRMNLIVVTKLLQRTGIRMDTASGGEEAVALCRCNTYDAILLDQRMPQMDGTQTLQAIRAIENGKNAETPVICLTADAIRGTRERLMAEGFTDYLSKPVEGQTLEKMLMVYLPENKIKDRPEEEKPKPISPWTAEKPAPASRIEKPRNLRQPEMAKKAEKTEKRAMAEEFNKPVKAAPSYAGLVKAGIDLKEGLRYCMDDLYMFNEILRTYVAGFEKRYGILERCYESKDWKNYQIEVHALKSNSKTIGAKALSDMAYSLEKAASEGDEAVLVAGHSRVMEMYEKIVFCAAEELGTDRPNGGSRKAAGANEDEIIEFEPE